VPEITVDLDEIFRAAQTPAACLKAHDDRTRVERPLVHRFESLGYTVKLKSRLG
jgi:hypothetical protein